MGSVLRLRQAEDNCSFIYFSFFFFAFLQQFFKVANFFFFFAAGAEIARCRGALFVRPFQ